jgi:hypothetical protein
MMHGQPNKKCRRMFVDISNERNVIIFCVALHAEDEGNNDLSKRRDPSIYHGLNLNLIILLVIQILTKL